MTTKVDVRPNRRGSGHDISLEIAPKRYGLKLEGSFDEGMQELPAVEDNTLRIGAAQRSGDYNPFEGHQPQETWHGGMGLEYFSDDPNRYYHGRFLWSMTPGMIHPAPLWKWADTDNRDYNMHQPGDVEWQSLFSDTKYISSSFTVAAQDTTSYDADKAYILLRRVGNPEPITVQIWSDDTGPDALVGNATKELSIDDITDTVSVWQKFDWSSTLTLTHAATYHIIIYGGTNDNKNNHWEVGTDPTGTSSYYSDDGSTWTVAGFTMYYRVVDADAAVKCHGFFLDDDDMYMVDQPASGDSEIYAWDETNDEWDQVTIAAGDDISNPVYSVAVSKNIAHMARSTTETIYTFYNNSGTYTGQDDTTGGNTADRLLAWNHPTDGPQIVRAENDNWYWSRSAVKPFNTNLSFSKDVKFEQGFDILSMAVHDGVPYVRTIKGLYSMIGDKPNEIEPALGNVLELTTADAPMLSKDKFLYFGWFYTIERLYQETLDDIGPWKDSGLPDGYQGKTSCYASDIGMIVVGIDGGTSNKSSVLAMTEQGGIFHPIWEAWETGQRVRNVWIQAQGASNPRRIWISVGTDTVYIDMPDESIRPTQDSDQEYCWESVCETATFNYGVEQPKKLFNELDILSKNLGEDVEICVDYKVDESSTWVHAGTVRNSPIDQIPLRLGNRNKIKFRYRMRTTDRTTPPVITATVLDGLVTIPNKRQWNLKIRIGGNIKGMPDHPAKEIYLWLLDTAITSQLAHMRTKSETMDDVWVKVVWGEYFREYVSVVRQKEGGVVRLTLREV